MFIRNVSKSGHRHPTLNQQCAAPIVEQYINTKTHASFAYKNTPRNSIVQHVATQKFTRNAQQTPQLYTHWNVDNSLVVTVSG